MPSSSAKTHRLGRQVWTTVRDSIDSWVWPLSTRAAAPRRPLVGLGIGRSFAAQHVAVRPEPVQRSLFHSSRQLFAPNIPHAVHGKISPNHVRRSCTSGGLLLLGLSSPSTSCTAAADTAIAISGATGQKSAVNISRWTWQAVRRGVPARRPATMRRYKSTSSRDPERQATEAQRPSQKPDERAASPPPVPPPQPGDAESIATSMSKYLQSHLPKIPPRPTKEEFLAAATGFWQRLRARFKWHSIRSMRPWNADEWGAFVSWFMLGHLLWILVGTTTFVSLIILTINTVFAQEELAKWVGDYLTQSAGITVVFESAIVPRWKSGVITFHNVFVSRRPGQVKSSVKKGSSSAAAIAAAQQTHDQDELAAAEELDDGNYTQFDVTINSVDVTLSFLKWWNGKGLLKDVEVKGVRGVLDRTHVRWSDGPLDPFSFRHVHQPGDFEIERFKIEDLMVTVHQPNDFRPFSVSIFSCELPQLRKQWLFYDFLSANHVSGSYDGSLFTIHPRQVQRPVTPSAAAAAMATDVVDNSHHNINNPVNDMATSESLLTWKKFSRLRIDALKIDHLNRGDRGPFGWIYEGNVDIVADVMLPAETDDGIAKAVSDFYDRMEEAVTSNRYIRILDGNYGSSRGTSQQPMPQVEVEMENTFGTNELRGNNNLGWSDGQAKRAAVPPVVTPSSGSRSREAPPPQYVIMDLRMHLNDVRAAVPFFPSSDALGNTRTQSYVNAQLIRPIVAYINAKRTYIPINCRIVKHLSDFDGSWTVYDCGLQDDSSAEVYAAFARDVEDQQSRVRRLKKVGFWTLSMVVHALLAGVAGDLM